MPESQCDILKKKKKRLKKGLLGQQVYKIQDSWIILLL